MRIVEGDVSGRDAIALSLNVYVSGACVADGKSVGRVVESVSLLIELLAAADDFPADGYEVRNKIDAQCIGGIRVESGIGDGAGAVRNFSNRGYGAQQVRLIRWGPVGNGPKRIHHPARAIGKLVREPPLIAEGSVRGSGKPLKISDPIVGAISRFFVGTIASFRVVEGFDSSQPRAVAIAALVWQIAAEFLAVSLFGCDGRAMNDVLRPFRGRFHPFDELSRMLAPVGILFGMQ